MRIVFRYGFEWYGLLKPLIVEIECEQMTYFRLPLVASSIALYRAGEQLVVCCARGYWHIIEWSVVTLKAQDWFVLDPSV